MAWKEDEQIIQLKGAHSNRCFRFDPKLSFFSCQQLLVSESSSYGCPYRYFTPENLQTALLSAYSSQGLKSSDLPEIMQTVKSNHFHVACTRVFEITHGQYGVKKGEGIGGGESVTHPNQYTAKSMEMEKESVKEETKMNVD